MIEKEIREYWDSSLLGDIKRIDIENLVNTGNYGKRNIIPMLIANIAAAFSTRKFLGKANENNLKSIKCRLDMSAAYTFDEVIRRNLCDSYVAASEGKDERGNNVIDPLKNLSAIDSEDLGLAVDVIDGTTLSAKGIEGAYTLSAASYGLKTFPDYQAYAVIGPTEVVNDFNFDSDETTETEELLRKLAIYSNKKVSELCIVTHSSDTGSHHRKIIDTVRRLGAKVIIPEPVIVEPTHVLGLGIGIGSQKPDLMLGVFGLPEILINSLILTTVSSKMAVKFRIASNSMLRFPQQEDLSNRFAFSEEELNEIDKLGLSKNQIYTNRDIAQIDKGCSFAITCLTGDPILGIPAITQNGNDVIVHSIFGDMDGNVYHITTVHTVCNEIDYTARYGLKIDDLSIVAFCDFEKDIIEAVESFESSTNWKCKWNLTKNMHVTLFEIGVHYGGFSGEEFDNAFTEWKKITERLSTPNTKIKGFVRRPYGVVCEMITEKSNEIKDNIYKNDFCNILKEPENSHITLCQFIAQLSEAEIEFIDSEIFRLNQLFINRAIHLSEPELIHIVKTPLWYK